jgi:proliferating cell nuclear antigen
MAKTEPTEDGTAAATAVKKDRKKNTKKEQAVKELNPDAPTDYITLETATMTAVLKALRALVPECRMHIMKDAITVQAVDTANVAMVELTMREEAFLDFHMKTDVIGLDVDRLLLGVSAMADGRVDLIRVNSQKFVLTDGVTRFDYVPLDPNTIRKDPNPPTIELPGTIIVNNAEFAENVATAKLFSDKAALTLQADLPENHSRLNIDAEGSMDKIHKQVEEMVDGSEPKGARGTWRSLFSLDYLADIAKVVKAAKPPAALKVQIGDDHPVKLSITIAPGVSVIYLLAPRIEAD